MIKSYFLPLSQAHQWPESQIGLLGYHLGKLVASEVTVAPGFLVPRETLLQIARENQLDHKLAVYLLQNAQPDTHDLQQLFSQLNINYDLSHTYLNAYYQAVANRPVTVVASWVSAAHGHLATASKPIEGDANVFKGILQTWAATVAQTLAGRTNPSLESLAPAALLVQTHLQPTLTGWLSTQSTHKSVYELVVQLPAKLKAPGETASFLIDIRTWHIVSSQLPEGVSQRQLESYISLNQMLEIAQIAYRVKLHDFHQLQISWEIADKQVYITNVERHQQLAERATTAVIDSQDTLLVGTPMISGLATAPAKVIFHPLSERQTFEQEIVVVRTLEHLSLNNLIGLRGVICEEVPSWQAQQLLNQHHIPTLGRVRAATQKLQSSQVVTLDTKRGKVLREQKISAKPTSIFSPKTRLRLAAVAHTAWDATEYPDIPSHNIIFQPESYWLSAGSHPLHLIKNHHSFSLKTELLRSLTSYRPTQQPIIYRPATLRSDQLFKLAHGASYESQESNPVLGFNGPARLLHQPELLSFEQELLTAGTQSLPNQLGVLLPAARTAEEMQQMLKAFSKTNPATVWAEIAYPANLWQLADFPLKKLEYLVIKTHHLLALAQGLDPYYPDLLALYPYHEALLRSLLSTALEHVSPKQIILEVKSEFQSMAHLSAELGLAGLMTNIHDVQTAHHLLQSAEQHRFSLRK